jgi:transcriptional regulator with XRE-family HTH domain
MSNERRSNSIDQFVGQRMKQRRLELRWSQEELATRLGVSFQQVQKYERAANRVSAGRLFVLAQVLAVPVLYFFDGLLSEAGLAEEGPEAMSLASLMATPGALDLLAAYADLESDAQRKAVVSLARSLAAAKPGADS